MRNDRWVGWIAWLALFAGCDETCTAVEGDLLGDIKLSAIDASGKATRTLRSNGRLVIEGRLSSCESSCADFGLSCKVIVGSGRLRFSVTGTACTAGDACNTACHAPTVLCVTPPLATGEYVLSGLSRPLSEDQQQYTVVVSDDGAEFDPRPF